MKKIITLLLILCMVFAMASCGKPSDTVDPEAEVEFLMVLITDKNGIEDNSLNESCWTGLQKAEIDFDVKVEYIEYDEAGYAKCFEEAVEMDPDLIICPNPDMAPVLTAVASQYMDDLFVIFDAEIPDAFNVTTVYFNPEQRAYLAGVAAALTSEENIVGFIGAESNELSDKYLYGFTAGVVSSDPYVYISTNHIGTTTDARTAKETAVAQCKLGADVIFHIVENAGTGVLDAAEERGFKVISLIPGQAIRAPEATLCTIAKNGEMVCYDLIKRMVEGTFDGSSISYGLSEDAFYISDDVGNISEEIMEKINTQIDIIKNGTLVVPYDHMSYQTFINGGTPVTVDESGVINTNPEMDVQ